MDYHHAQFETNEKTARRYKFPLPDGPTLIITQT